MAAVLLSYAPAEPTATVSAVRFYTDPARTGAPVASGVPTFVGGVWTYTPDLPDGDYYTAWDVTDSTGTYTDADDFFYVLQGEIVLGSQVVSAADVRGYLNLTDKTQDAEVVLHVAAAVDVLAEHIGSPILPTVVTETHPAAPIIVLRNSRTISLTSVVSGSVTLAGYALQPGGLLAGGRYGYGAVTVTYVTGFDRVPSAVRLAVLEYVRKLWESQRGPASLPFGGGEDTQGFASGFAADLPNKVQQLLAPYRRGVRVA